MAKGYGVTCCMWSLITSTISTHNMWLQIICVALVGTLRISSALNLFKSDAMHFNWKSCKSGDNNKTFLWMNHIFFLKTPCKQCMRLSQIFYLMQPPKRFQSRMNVENTLSECLKCQKSNNFVETWKQNNNYPISILNLNFIESMRPKMG